MKHLAVLLFLTMGVALSGCLKKEISPSDAITTEVLTSNLEGLMDAVNGAYSLMKDHVSFNGTVDDNNMYLRQYFQMSSFAGDNVVCAQVTEDPLFLSFTYNHTPTQANARYFWYISYKIINDCNTVIEATTKDSASNLDPATQQLVGECYFLRAFCTFNLVRFYAKPYTQDSTAPGIILRLSTNEPSQKKRATVAEVYNQVISDALKGATLMNKPRGVTFASKEAAWALLSRVFLYKGDNQNCIKYSTKVIQSGRFSLCTADQFKTMFANAQSSPETIFCIGFTDKEDYGKFGSIASMVYSDGNSGWGEEFASSSLRDLMSKHPEDVRWNYIVPLYDDNGNIVLKNGIPTYYCTKFSFQNGSPTLSSPIMFRMAEMYLNRAEAYAKLGDIKDALDDVDAVRRNRGLESSLYNGTVPNGMTALQIVLNERRIEFAFEGFRMFDLFRNNLPLVRDYWGYHLEGLTASDIDLSKKPQGYPNEIIQPNDTRIQYYIPIDEIQANKLCVQNP
ncbi:MAG: RagB/SusD family nutrient uptake outer membrane protein [Acidobacterium ailaaui]|nr:RagB/SusD family nutrient uptake outer membrane protein [Pseudacidobacterium ailaaui]